MPVERSNENDPTDSRAFWQEMLNAAEWAKNESRWEEVRKFWSIAECDDEWPAFQERARFIAKVKMFLHMEAEDGNPFADLLPVNQGHTKH